MQPSNMQLGSALSIYMNAERYFYAYTVLRKAVFYDQNATSIIAPPSMVLSAFAIELYFKCLRRLEGSSIPQTHNLKALFRDLSPQTKNQIQQLWDAYAPSQEPLWQTIEKTTGKTIPRDFSELLAISSKAFNELRYLHEDDSGSFFVGDLPPMLKAVILRRMPIWATLRHTPPTSLSRGTPAQAAKPPQSQPDGSQ
jgi:hypothetical protein